MNSIQTNSGYQDWLSKQTGTTSKANNTGQNYDAVFVEEEDTGLGVDDFLNLMVAELQNQDFMNPVDNSQYVAQMAQFANLQQMQDLASYSKTNYVTSLVGKNVTAAKFTVSGNLDKVTGNITKVSLVDNDFKVFIGNKSFSLSQIMEVNQTPKEEQPEPPTKKEDDEDPEPIKSKDSTAADAEKPHHNEAPDATNQDSEVTDTDPQLSNIDPNPAQTSENEPNAPTQSDKNKDSLDISDNTSESKDQMEENSKNSQIDPGNDEIHTGDESIE